MPDDDKTNDDDRKDDPKRDDHTDEEFDKDRAMDTIRKQRESETAALQKVKDLEAKVKQFEDADKSEQDKLTERATNAEARADQAEKEVFRLRVALRKGLDETQAKRLVGDDEDALEKDADDLLKSFRGEDKKDDEPDTARRPRERLRSGNSPTTEPEKDDPKTLADAVSPGW